MFLICLDDLFQNTLTSMNANMSTCSSRLDGLAAKVKAGSESWEQASSSLTAQTASLAQLQKAQSK